MKLRRLKYLGVALILVTLGAVALSRPREPSYDGKPLTYWLYFINGPTRSQRSAAEAAVRGMGARALPALLQRIVAKEPWWKRKLKALAKKQSLIRLTFDPVNRQSMEAAIALGALGPDAISGLPILLPALQDEDSGVRACAAQALGAIGSPTAIPLLIACFEDQDVAVRLAAVDSLGSIGSSAIPAIFAAMRQEKVSLQLSALQSLGAVIDRNFQRRNPTPTAFKVQYPGTPMFAKEEIFPPANGVAVTDVLAILALRLKSNDPQIRGLAAMVLGHFGSEASSVQPALVEALKDANQGVQLAAQSALIAIGYTNRYNQPNPSLNFKFPDQPPIGATLFKDAERPGVGY